MSMKLAAVYPLDTNLITNKYQQVWLFDIFDFNSLWYKSSEARSGGRLFFHRNRPHKQSNPSQVRERVLLSNIPVHLTIDPLIESSHVSRPENRPRVLIERLHVHVSPNRILFFTAETSLYWYRANLGTHFNSNNFVNPSFTFWLLQSTDRSVLWYEKGPGYTTAWWTKSWSIRKKLNDRSTFSVCSIP